MINDGNFWFIWSAGIRLKKTQKWGKFLPNETFKIEEKTSKNFLHSVFRYDKQGRELQEEETDHEDVAPEEFTTNTEPVEKWTNEKPPCDEWTNGKPSDDWNSQGDTDWSTERVECPRSLIIDETEYSETQMVRFR